MSNNEDKGNQGVIVTGGNVNVGDMAVGKNASVNKTNESSASDGLHAEVTRLIELMEKAGVDPGQVEAARVAQQELEKDKPNDMVVSSILGTVLESVKGVKDIATAVAAVSGLIFG